MGNDARDPGTVVSVMSKFIGPSHNLNLCYNYLGDYLLQVKDRNFSICPKAKQSPVHQPLIAHPDNLVISA